MALKDYKKVIKDNLKNKVVKPIRKKATQIVDDMTGKTYEENMRKRMTQMMKDNEKFNNK